MYFFVSLEVKFRFFGRNKHNADMFGFQTREICSPLVLYKNIEKVKHLSKMPDAITTDEYLLVVGQASEASLRTKLGTRGKNVDR